jgi:hypothetical protein
MRHCRTALTFYRNYCPTCQNLFIVSGIPPPIALTAV